MILVSVGASQFPFDRLVRAIDDLSTPEELVVQHGPSLIRPANARCYPFVPFDDLAELVREARVVITHAGVGSILVSLMNGKQPFVVPRLRAFNETVDDHQLECARRFATAGLVTLIEDANRLKDALEGSGRDSQAAFDGPTTDLPLVRDLRNYLEALTGGPRQRGDSRVVG